MEIVTNNHETEPLDNGLTISEIEDIRSTFFGKKCPVCGRLKKERTAFCGRDYYRLPNDLRSNLWYQMGAGFEEAFAAALKWLQEQ